MLMRIKTEYATIWETAAQVQPVKKAKGMADAMAAARDKEKAGTSRMPIRMGFAILSRPGQRNSTLQNVLQKCTLLPV
jgi:hypothetical protein